MAYFRTRGSIGHRLSFGLGTTNGSIDSPWGFDLELKPEFTPITPGTVDFNNWVRLATQAAFRAALAARKEDEEELKLLVKIYSHLANKSGKTRYSYWSVKWQKKGKKKRKVTTRVYLVDEYVKDRDALFGSRAAYKEALAEATKELDHKPPKGRTLRFWIEPQEWLRKKHKNDWKKAQNVFYTWVRKAFHRDYGKDKDYPSVVRTGMSQELKDKMKKVRSNYDQSFKAGGINPRPAKLKIKGVYHYRLGTVSDHAIGHAIDIEAASNPQLSIGRWNKLQKYTGKSMSSQQRRTTWKKDPKKLYDHVKAVSDEFVKKVKKAVDAVVADAKKKVDDAKAATVAAAAELEKRKKDMLKTNSGAALVEAQQKVLKEAQLKQAKAEAEKKAVDAAIAVLKNKKKKNSDKKAETKLIIDQAQKKDAALKAIGDGFIIDWWFERSGFISLPWDLVEACHDAGLKWGATFPGNIDIHHFEL